MCIFGTDCFDCGPRTATAPPRPPPPPPARSVGCSNTCYAFGDGYCDDGGGGAEYSECAGGTDCTDCGPRDMSVVGFALQLAGDVSSFTPLVRTEMQSAIATVAGVHPSSVTVDVTSGSVIVDVRILTPTTTATLVQSAMVSATSTQNSRTSMFASVSGVSVTVLAVVTPPTVSASTPTVTSAPTFTTTDNIRDTGNSLALPLGLGLGLGLGGCLVLSALFVFIKRHKVAPKIEQATDKPPTRNKPHKV